MKTTIKKTVLAVCIGFITVSALGQDLREAYQKTVDGIFSGIPSEKITTGILIERAPTFVDMYRYEGACKEKDTCNVKKWKQMYLQLNVAHLDSRKFKYDSRIVETDYQRSSNTNDIPLGIIFYDYNRINPYALSKGLLSIDTVKNVVRDISSTRETPLETVTCFAASPMVEILPAGTHSFYIEPSLFISNKTQSFDEVAIDFGDGKGFVSLPANGRVSANFETSGIHILTIKAIQKDITHLSYSAVYVQGVPKSGSLLRATSAVIDSSVVTPDLTPDDFVSVYDKAGVKAQYGIWYRCNHDNTIRKPLLIVSGFDPSDNVRVQVEYIKLLLLFGIYVPMDKLYLYRVANKDGFLDRLRENGYDIIVYRSTQSDKSIIDNAKNLVELIKKINNEKTSNNELIVVGASMGGLVARYALTYMEHKDIPHKTKLFVTIDSPQCGANIPLGFQHMVSSLNNDLKGLATAIDMLKDAENRQLGCVAAKQMLLYHHKATTGKTAKCAPERTAFLDSLSFIGNFPKKCQSLAVSMGSGTGIGQGFSAGQTLLKKNTSTIENAFLNTVGVNAIGNAVTGLLGSPSWTELIWSFELKAVPNHTAQTIYKEKISVKVTFLPFLLPIPTTITEVLANPSFTVNNTDPLDNAPGSIKGLHNLKDFDKMGLSDVLNLFGTITKDNHYDCFIPAYSALGLSLSPQFTPHTNIKTYLASCSGVEKINNNSRFYRNYNKAVSPFDYLYIEESNMNHIAKPDNSTALTSDMITIMEGLLIPSQLNLGDKTITSGQSIAYEAKNITVDGNFVVEPGGKLEMRGSVIHLKPGFHAKAGSTVHIKADDSWICPAGSIQSVSFSPLSSIAWEEVPNINTKEEQPAQVTTPEIENELRFFPNPVENILNLRILNKIEGEIKITVLDVKGQVVYSQLIMNNIDNAIDCSQFSSGVYLVNIACKDSIQKTIKIIKK